MKQQRGRETGRQLESRVGHEEYTAGLVRQRSPVQLEWSCLVWVSGVAAEEAAFTRGPTGALLGDAVPLSSLEISLDGTPSTADAASRFVSVAILRASLWDGSNSKRSSSNNSPTSASAATAAETVPPMSPTAMPTTSSARAAAAATTTAAADPWECLPIPEEGVAISWPHVSPRPLSYWGPSRNPFAAPTHN